MKNFIFNSILLVFFVTPQIKSANKPDFEPLDNRYALVIGISEYQDKNIQQLEFADNDAEDFYQALIDYARFKEDNIKLLLNQEATRENIRKNIQGWLKQTGKDDIIFIFFSGHGGQEKDYNGDENDGIDEYLITYDFNRDDHSSGICDDDFALWISNLLSDHILIVFDCCHSGGAARSKGLPNLVLKDEAGDSLSNWDHFREIPRDGVALIASSRPMQVSWESPKLGNGVFTYSILESIDHTYDDNNDMMIDVEELFASVRTKTSEYTHEEFNRIQEPIFINGLKESINIFYIPFEQIESTDIDELDEILYKARNAPNDSIRIAYLEEAFKKNPKNLRVHHELGGNYAFIKKYEKAIYHYEYLFSNNQSYRWADDIADVLTASGDTISAITWYEKSIALDGSERTCNKLAYLYLSQKEMQKAIKICRQSIETNPMQRDAYILLFNIHYTLEKDLSAFDAIEECLKINPYDSETIYWNGIYQKHHYKNDVIGDSLLEYFNKSSRVNEYIDKVDKGGDNRDTISLYNLSEKDSKRLDELHASRNYSKSNWFIFKLFIDQAIREYPYYSDFYKEMVDYLGSSGKWIVEIF